MKQTLQEWAQRIGVRIVPLVSINDTKDSKGRTSGGKRPVGKDWGIRHYDAKEFVFTARETRGQPKDSPFKAGEYKNIGFVLGPPSKGLVDIDLDCEAAIARAGEFFGDLGCVEFGRSGKRTHLMLRATMVPEDVATRYTGMVNDGDGNESVGIEFRTGHGKTRTGDPFQLQTMTRGFHPDTWEQIEFIGRPPSRFEDFPQVSFSEILERFGALCDAIDARKVWIKPERVQKQHVSRMNWEDDDKKLEILGRLPPLSVMCAEYAGDALGGRDQNQQCPFCQNGGKPVLSVNDEQGVAYCFWDGCESRAFASGGGFDAFHLIGHMERLTEFPDILEFAAKKAGVEFQKRKKKNGKKSKNGKSEKGKRGRPEGSKKIPDEIVRQIGDDMATRHLKIHGQLYATFDQKGWLPESQEQLASKIRIKGAELTGEHIAKDKIADIALLSEHQSLPPADSPEFCPPEHRGLSLNVDTGDLLRGAAFFNCSLQVLDDGAIEQSERTLKELWVNPVPHMWLDERKPTPVWDKFLLEFAEGAVGDDELEVAKLQTTIYTMIGASLFDNRFQKIWVLFGAGGTGKSVILDVLRAVVGHGNWFAVKLADFAERFALANMRNRKVVCLPELKPRPAGRPGSPGVEKFDDAMLALKRISGGDAVGMEIKNIQHTVDAVIDANLVAATNTLSVFPRYGEEPSAWERRLIVIPAPIETVAKPDPTLGSRIISQELPGIIHEAVHSFAGAVAGREIVQCERGLQLLRDAVMDELGEFVVLFEPGNREDKVWNPEIRKMWAAHLEKPEEGLDIRRPVRALCEAHGAIREDPATPPTGGRKIRCLSRLRVVDAV